LNQCTSSIGGVYDRGKFDASGGVISGNKAPKNNDVYIYVSNMICLTMLTSHLRILLK